jgi:hypothetical protein
MTKSCLTQPVANAMSALAMPQLSNRQLLCFCQNVPSVSVSAAVWPTTEYKNSKQNCVTASNFKIRQLSSSVLLHVTLWLSTFRRHYVLPKRPEPNDSVISQQTRMLGNTAVRTSNILLEMRIIIIIICHFLNKTKNDQWQLSPEGYRPIAPKCAFEVADMPTYNQLLTSTLSVAPTCTHVCRHWLPVRHRTHLTKLFVCKCDKCHLKYNPLTWWVCRGLRVREVGDLVQSTAPLMYQIWLHLVKWNSVHILHILHLIWIKFFACEVDRSLLTNSASR